MKHFGGILVFWANKLKLSIRRIANISDGTDVTGTIKTIKKDIHIRGSNIWILVCSTMLASIGLDLNSAAVIIGAMLISPLMSPILGVGLSVGINDRETLIESLKNLGIAVVVSFITAILYFFISPLGEPTSEMLARTQPTLLDIFVAFFGGVAGIVAGSRTEKTNAIPGVAIATALMPPICVAGFGIATGHWDYFIGAFYLFFINAVFIATSTYLIVRFLRFPYKEFIDLEKQKRVKRWMLFFVVIIMAPSFYFLFNIINEVRIKKKIEHFVTEYVEPKNAKLLDWRLVKKGKTAYIDMTLQGEHLPVSEIKKLYSAYKKERVGYDLKLTQLADMTFKEIEKRTSELKNDFTTALVDKESLIISKTIENKQLQDKLNLFYEDSTTIVKVNKEIKILFPDLDKFAYVKANYNNKEIPTALVKWDKRVRNKIKKQNENKMRLFLLNRLELDTIQIVNQ